MNIERYLDPVTNITLYHIHVFVLENEEYFRITKRFASFINIQFENNL